MRAILVGVVVLVGACPSRGDDSRRKIAKLGADKLVEHAVRWQLSASQACPDSLLAVAEHSGIGKEATIDPWETPYELFCGDRVPPEARGPFAVLSYGPDKKKGTADDIASWRPLP